MKTSRIVDVAELIDVQSLGQLHWRVMTLSFALVLIDSYDILAIAFVAPLLQHDWHFPTSALGLLFGSTIVGSALGPLLFGYFADRLGRRPVVLLGTLWFGALTTAAVWSTSLNQLMLIRLLAGLGMGAVLSIVSAQLTEFAPRRIRGTMTVAAFLGVLLGGGLGALVASQVLRVFSWHAIFWIGGLIPIVIAFVAFFAFPESIRFLTLRPGRRSELIHLIRQLDPKFQIPLDAEFVLGDEVNAARFSFKALFSRRLAIVTPLLWLCNGVSLIVYYFVVQWTPVLLSNAGAPIQTATLATAAFQICGFAAALAVMRPIDRHGFLPVPFLFAIGVPAISSIGIHGLTDTSIIALAGAAGFCVSGIQMSMVATQGQVYSTSVRAWGVGFCFGAGRLGAVFGSILSGVLVGRNIPINYLFYLSGGAMVLGVLSSGLLVPAYRSQLRDMRGTAASADDLIASTVAADLK